MNMSNLGHGHVFPRADGVSMRCGGPTICVACARDLARKIAEESIDNSVAYTKLQEKYVAQSRRLANIERVLMKRAHTLREATAIRDFWQRRVDELQRKEKPA